MEEERAIVESRKSGGEYPASFHKMESPELAFTIWLLACVSGPADGYPNGKVTEACSSMMPLHGHYPQLTPKHIITASETEFRPGDHIKVTLSGPDFEGFLIQARDAENLDGPTVGSFMLVEQSICQLLTCNHVKNSAVSHTHKSKKNHLEAYWIASPNAPKHVQFLATVVEKYHIFWVKIPGPIISQPNAPPLTTIPTTPKTQPTSQPVSHLIKPFNASGCGFMKFCIRNPTNCNPEAANCFFLSFKPDGHSVIIEMSGPSEGYLAFALSYDQWMGDDDAYLCVNEDHRININTAFLRGRSSPVLDSENTLEDMSWRLADGVLQCSFRRKIHLSDNQRRYNLDVNYYIFLADGEVGEGGPIYKHQRQPLISNGMCNVTGPPKDLGGSRSPQLIKIHGALMFVAWMTTVSIGVIVARFFKPVWPHSLLFGKEIWFQVHRTLMLTTVALTSIAFILPFIYRGGWSYKAGFHPYLGCTVMALAIFQPLVAGFRPSPHGPRRQLFNWVHWSTGTTARILAVVTMFLGMDLPALKLPYPWDTYTMIGFVAWHVGIDVLLEIHGYCLIHKVELIDDDRIHILQSLTSVEAEGRMFKQIVLTIYICGNIAFLITFLAAINQL
ncbi:putative ferric-chelate reductase 1 [Alligator mississippiensis]|uniref:Ferric-chelate reductase 1 n=1 Tax=Alligator mississippiensis TaxID=8496 RepID=A0A151M546_ALLMI|nr:putative ferric-chelate reductase 1 [Alligator mississippiensis]